MKKTIYCLIVLSALIVGGLTSCVSTAKSKPEPEPAVEQITINTADIKWVWENSIFQINGTRYDLYRLQSPKNDGLQSSLKDEYAKVAGRLMTGGPFTLYFIPKIFDQGNNSFPIIKIEGLMSVEEYDAFVLKEKERRIKIFTCFFGNRVKISVGYYNLVDWSNAFSTSEEAKKWYDNIRQQIDNIDEVIVARKKLYDDNVTAFRALPSRIMLNTVTKNKNDLIDAYNRYKPINSEVSKIIKKGVFVELVKEAVNLTNDEILKYNPVFGLTENEVIDAIQNINSAYAKLVDTYPVN